MRDARIGQVVRVKRGATVRCRGERVTLDGNRQAGTVRQVWRVDPRTAWPLIDADARRVAVRLSDLRPVQGAPAA